MPKEPQYEGFVCFICTQSYAQHAELHMFRPVVTPDLWARCGLRRNEDDANMAENQLEKVEGFVWCDHHGEVHADDSDPYSEGGGKSVRYIPPSSPHPTITEVPPFDCSPSHAPLYKHERNAGQQQPVAAPAM